MIIHVNKNNRIMSQFMQQQRNHLALSILGNGKNLKRDSFIPDTQLESGVYTKSTVKRVKFSTAVLDAINFEYTNTNETEDSFLYGGIKYFKSDIPSIDLDRCLDIKAENNKIVFQTGAYYKFTDQQGNTHALSCAYNGVSQPYSELVTGNQNDISYEMGKFWSMLSSDGTYMGLYYSHDTQRQFLNNAGITNGFFSVQAGAKQKEYFYSNGVAGVAVPKSRYDTTYNMFMHDKSVLEEFEVGSVFLIGGKEYTLNAERQLDIPYGADIYDIKYPKKSA